MHQTRVQAGRDNITLAGTEIHFHQAGDKEPFSPLHQLPSPPANFTGRDEELAELEKELTAAHKSGATISGKHAGLQGMGGVGKTALATVLAHKLKDHYPDAQLYLNLRGADPEHRAPVTPADTMQSIIHAFQPEAKLPEELDKLTPIYNGVLNEAGRVLLFLDNAADGEQVKPLVPPANCLLLVTSREHFSLPSMVVRDIDCLRAEKSQELLLKLAPRISGYEKEAAELCDHLPLALEVFAGVVESHKIYPVPDLVERLRRQPAKLTKADAAFQVSYDLLADDLRRRWTMLAMFSGSFDLAAAAAVWEEHEDFAREAMQPLVNASLVEWHESDGRFRQHDLVRQFCDSKLTDAERTTGKQGFARHYREVAEETERLYDRGSEHVLRALELFDQERTNIEAAFQWLQSREDKESGDQLLLLVNALTHTTYLRFHPHQIIRWRQSQLKAARDSHNRKSEGLALANIGNAYSDLGEAHKAIEFHEQYLAIAREIKDRRAEGRALGKLGIDYWQLGNALKSIEFCEQQLAIHREFGTPRDEGDALGTLAIAYGALHEEHKAIEFLEQQLEIDRKIGDRRAEGAALGNLGLAHKNLGDVSKAIELYKQQLAICRQLGNRRSEGITLGNLGVACSLLGDERKAIELHEQHLAVSREVGDRESEGNALGNLGTTYLKLGDVGKAIEFLEHQLAIVCEIGYRRGEANALGNLGIAHKKLGDLRKAIKFFEQELVIAREIGDKRRESKALWSSARAHESIGNRPDAIARAETALKIFEAIGDPKAAKVHARLAEWRGQA